MTDRPDTERHLDKRVPVAIILALALQARGAVWWASGATGRLSDVERRLEGFAVRSEAMRDTLQDQGQAIAVV
jgi:hypothetical protein